MDHYNLKAPYFLLLLSGVLFFCFFVNLGNVPLFDEDEGAYSEVTREMLESKDFLTPRLNGEPFFHKPPMIYWVQMAGVSLLGLNEFALRLPSALASLLWALALYGFTRRYFKAHTAWYAVFFMAVSLQTGIIAKAAIADALLNLFITLTLFCCYLFYERRDKKYVYLTFLFMGLGFLSKGPIAILIPLVTTGLFFLVKKQMGAWARAIFNPIGWGIFLIVSLPWYVAMGMTHGRGFIDEFFLTQNINRFQASFEGHSGSVLYYIPVILVGMLPNTAFLIKAIAGARKLLQKDVNLFLFIWFIFVFIFFSLAGTKLHHYVVYGYVPLFIFMAQAADEVKHSATQLVWPMAFLLLLFFLPEIAARMQPAIGDDFAKHVVESALPLFGLKYKIILGGAFLLITALLFVKSAPRMAKTILSGLIFVAVINLYILPIAGSIMQQPVKEAALLAKKHNMKVIMWGMNYPSFFVYRQQLDEKRKPRSGDIVISKITRLAHVERYEILYQKHGIVLFRIIEL